MDNTVNKKSKISKKLKNKESSIDSNENQPTLSKKRKKLDTDEELTHPQKSKKKKSNIVTDDVDNMFNNVTYEEGSSQIVSRTITRSRTNTEVTAVEKEGNIENFNELIKFSKKSKKKVKDENSQVEANIQMNEPFFEDIPLTRQKIKNKRKKIKLEADLHTELQIKNEESDGIDIEWNQMLDDYTPALEINPEEQEEKSTKLKDPQASNTLVNSLNRNDFSMVIQENNDKKHKKKTKMKLSEQIQNQSTLPVTILDSLESVCSTSVKSKTKSKIKRKNEMPLEIPDCSNGFTNVFADFLTFGQGHDLDNNINAAVTVSAVNVNVENTRIPVKKSKKKASQLVSNEENVIVSNQNYVMDQMLKTEGADHNNTKSLDSDRQNHSLLEVSSDLDMLALNNNDIGMKTEVNIIDIKSEDAGESNENVVHISIRDVDVPVAENDLLNQLEKNIVSPTKKRDQITWSQYDLQKLLSRIEVGIPQNDNLPFIKRLERLEWDTITFDNYTVEQCKDMWLKVSKKVRRYRLLNELVQDAKDWVRNTRYGKSKSKKKLSKNSKHPDMPRKPLTPYFIYYLEFRDSYHRSHPGVDASAVAKALAQQFTSLPPDTKKKYDEIAALNREQYAKDLEAFYKKHPEVPRGTSKKNAEKPPKPPKPPKLPKPPKQKPPPPPPKDKAPTKPRPPFYHFFISELEKNEVEDKLKFKEECKERWKQLPERNKLVWIHFAEAEETRYQNELAEYVKKHPDFAKFPVKPILTREDMQIKERAAGKPVKPPGSAYNLFASTLLHSDSIKDVPMKERLLFASNQWKFCSEEEKKQYKDKFEELVKKYQEDYAVYLESLSDEQRKVELAKNVPKKPKPEKQKEEIMKQKEEIAKKKEEAAAKKKEEAEKKKEELAAKKKEEAEKKKELAERKKEEAEKKKEEAAKKKEEAAAKKGKKKQVSPKEPKTATHKKAPQQLNTATAPLTEIKMEVEEHREKLKEPEQPPISPMKYFAKLYTGAEPVTQVWKSLTKVQKKFYEQELDKKKREYIEQFEKFLKSMTKEELAEFSSSRKRMKQQQEEEERSDDSDTEDSSDEDDEDEDE